MKKGFNQMIAIVMIAVSSVAFTGCDGSFSLTSKLHNWNGQVSNAKFVNELVFLGLCILPAYELCCLGDARSGYVCRTSLPCNQIFEQDGCCK